jgi:hypothetical protein
VAAGATASIPKLRSLHKRSASESSPIICTPEHFAIAMLAILANGAGLFPQA